MTSRVIAGTFLETDSDVQIRFSFSSDNPLAVKMEVFHDDDIITWELGRELLHEGYRHGAGLGDVHICVYSLNRLRIHLSTDEASATLEMSRWLVRSFLVDTYHVIPKRHKRAKRCDDHELPTPRRNAREAKIIENAIDRFLDGLPAS